MVTYTPEQLIISITDSSPNERRDWLIKAIAATMRWRANAGSSITLQDDENQVVLAQLLEELIEIDHTMG